MLLPLNDYIATLPRPLAKALTTAGRARGKQVEDAALYKLAQAYVRYGVLVDLARYTHLHRSGAQDAALEKVMAGWAAPSFGKWLEYARATQAALGRLGAESVLPKLAERLDSQEAVDFLNLVRGGGKKSATLQDFLGAVVAWRNDDAHDDGLRNDQRGCALLRDAFAAMLEASTSIRQQRPVHVTLTATTRMARDKTRVTYDVLVGTGDPLDDTLEVPSSTPLFTDTLYLADPTGCPVLELTPFLHWDPARKDLCMLDSIKGGQPRYHTETGEDWAPLNLTDELKGAAEFIFTRPKVTPTGPMVAAFREVARAFLVDGVLSEVERGALEVQRQALGISEDDARAIVDDVLVAAPLTSSEAQVAQIEPPTGEVVVPATIPEAVVLPREGPPAKPAVAPVAPPSTGRSTLGQIVELVDEQKTPTWGRGINFVLLGALRSQNGRCTRQYLLDSLTRSVALKEVQTRCDLPMLTYGFCTMGIRDGWLRVAAAQPAPAVEPVPPAPTVPGLEWPESGRAFLARVKRRAHGQLAFVPVAVASDAEIAAVENDKGDLWFMATPVHSLSVWFSSKRGEHVYVVVGFYSNNKSRDPEYRHVREAIESAMGGRPLFGGWSLMRPKWRDLAIEGYRRVVMEELHSEALLDETVAALVHLSHLVADHLDGVRKAVGVEADTTAQPAEGTGEEDEHDEGNSAPGIPGQAVYHLNVGGYSLTDDLRHGHWEAGGGARYRAAVVRLKPGDTVYLYRSGVGYVAAGLVTGEQAVRLETYVEERGLEVDATTAAFVASSRGQPDETAEWVREIAWRSVRPIDQGFRVRDHLPTWSVPIMTACRIMNPEVVALLAREFGDVEAARPGEPG